jgi:hypothetical protein
MSKRSTRATKMTTVLFNQIIITLLGCTTKRHRHKVLVSNKIADIADVSSLDRGISCKMTADKMDEKGVVKRRDGEMNFFLQTSVLTMGDM